ncbi:hypothetical protein [Ectobacillus sp. sgz5001026]|uniref:hypothetical protein n=1 Tax=Ectobacillus sp. sgz5001026 TaxID=3242473 RepID=UPI0036D36C23
MKSGYSFYMFVFTFVLVAILTVYLIIDNNWYNTVSPILLILMYVGIATVSFGMREEMLKPFEK